MPLHKPAPQSEHLADDKDLWRKNSHYRRRTLQTVRELTSEDGLPNDTSSPETKNTSSITQIDQRPRSRTSHRRSLPHDASKTQRASSNTPRDHTIPSNGLSGNSSTGNSGRFSVEFTSTNKPLHRQVSNLKPRRHSLPRDSHFSNLEQPDQSQTSPLISKEKGKQPVRAQDVLERSTPEEGWNVRRERELKKREQELVEARMCQEKERRGLAIGSLSVLPSSSPLPAKPNDIYIRSRVNQQQRFQNNLTAGVKRSNSRLLVPRPSVATIAGHTGSNTVNAQLLKTASTNNSLHMTAHYDPAQRLRFTNLTPTGTRISRAASQRQSAPAPPSSATLISRSLSSSAIPMASQSAGQFQPTFPYPPPAAIVQDWRSRTPSSQERSSRRSSVGSTATTTTSLSTSTQRSQISSSPHSGHPRSSRRSHQNGVTKEHLDDLAAFTSSTPTPNGRTRENVGSLEGRQRRPSDFLRSPSSSSSRRLNPLHPEYRPRSRTNSRASHYSYTTTSNQSTTIYGDGDASPQIPMGPGSAAAMKMGSENVRLQREREKLLIWKAEREKLELEKSEREKVKERVRRANEMEEERRREVDEKGKKGRGVCGCLVM